MGDTHTMSSTVTRKYVGEHGPAIDLQIWGENQRGETTCPGHATILLPSREHGPVTLPAPPADAANCEETLAALVDRFAQDAMTEEPD